MKASSVLAEGGAVSEERDHQHRLRGPGPVRRVPGRLVDLGPADARPAQQGGRARGAGSRPAQLLVQEDGVQGLCGLLQTGQQSLVRALRRDDQQVTRRVEGVIRR